MAYSPLELAQAFISTGELQDALDALNTHLEAQSADDDARRLRAEVLSRFADSASLKAARDDLLQIQQPTADDWHKVAIIAQKLDDLDVAHAAYRQALDLRPNDERLTEQWMRLYQSQGDLHSAQQLIDTMPHTWRWRSHAAEIHEDLGQYDPADAAYTDALQLLNSHNESQVAEWTAPFAAALHLRRANVYVIQERYSEAEDDYQAAGQRIPDDPIIAFRLGLIALMQGDAAQGRVLCQQAFNAAPAELRAAMVTELQERGYDADLSGSNDPLEKQRRITP